MYLNFANLIECRGLNGYIELNGMKLTQWQLDALEDYIRSNRILDISYIGISTYGLTIVNSLKNSDLRVE